MTEVAPLSGSIPDVSLFTGCGAAWFSACGREPQGRRFKSCHPDCKSAEILVMRKVGVVIGSFNMPQFVELQLAAIQFHCGSIPILIADNCSDGFDQPYDHPKEAKYWQLYRHVMNYSNAVIWPNPSYVGWGGDIAAYWKGIVWGKSIGLDVVFKLSQRCIVDYPDWAQISAERLCSSGQATLGRGCDWHKWGFRTESAGLNVNCWYDPDILRILRPRDLNGWPTEQLMYDDIIKPKFGGMCTWELMSPARPVRSEHILYREANRGDHYIEVARKVGVQPQDYDCRSREACKDMDRVADGVWSPPGAQ